MEVKGTSVQATRAFVETTFGSKAYANWLAALSPSAQQIYGAPLATAWYPAQESILEPLRLICTMFYGGDLKGARDTGRFAADRALRGVYKLFLKLGSPEFIVSRIPRLFEYYYRPGKVVIASMAKGRAVFLLPNFPEYAGVWETRMAGYVERALEISGVAKVDVKVLKASGSDMPNIEVEFTWG